MNSTVRKIYHLNELWFVAMVVVFIPLNFFLSNIDKANFEQSLPSFGIVSSVFLIYLVNLLVLRKKSKALLSTLILTIIIFFHGAFVNIVGEFTLVIGNFRIGEDKTLFGLWGIIIILTYIILFRSNYVSTKLLLGIKVFVFALFTQSVTLIAVAMIKGDFTISEYNNGRLSKYESSRNAKSELSKYNVYHIVLDKYTSNKVLEESFNYDNSEFTQILRDKGFKVNLDAHTNYPHSLYSLSSTLNMQYADEIAGELGVDPNNNNGERAIMYPAFLRNKIGKIFKDEGYTNYHIGSWYFATSRSDFADHNLIYNNKKYTVDEYTFNFLQNSMIPTIADRYFLIDNAELYKLSINYSFSKLKDLVYEINYPKYVFSHIIFPHPPFLYDEDCQELTTAEKALSYEILYVKAIRCANIKVLDVIDTILNSGSENSIIILTADEGAGGDRDEMQEDDYNFVNASYKEIERRTGILSAIYFPDKNYSHVSDSITNINLYRLILSQYFGYDYDLVEDKVYITDTIEDLYKFNFNQYEPDVR